MICLRKVDEDNFQECLILNPNVENKDYVDPVSYSFAEAWLEHDHFELYAIYNADQVIGFISIYFDQNSCQIINFLIDEAFQNKGYGKIAAKQCIDHLKNQLNAKKIILPVHTDNLKAQKFWEKLGFYYTDSVEDAYVFMRLAII